MFRAHQSCRQVIRRRLQKTNATNTSTLFDFDNQQIQQRWGSSKKKKNQAMKRQRNVAAPDTSPTPLTSDAKEIVSKRQPHSNENRTASTEIKSSASSFTVAESPAATTPATSEATTFSPFDGTGKRNQQHVQLPFASSDGATASSWQTDKKALEDLLAATSPSIEELAIRESMFDPKIHLPHAPQQWTLDYEPATPLSDALIQQMGVSGKPITVAEYMRNALTHPLYGYYTSQTTATDSEHDDDDDWDNDIDGYSTASPADGTNTVSKIFGRTGDFITAPEVSHVFGHCICVWFITQWETLSKPSKIQLVELGPGRGTLMTDILQLALTMTLKENKTDFGKSIERVHLIETSLELRQQQASSLVQGVGDLVDLEFVGIDGDRKGRETGTSKDETAQQGDKTKPIIRIEWHDDFTSFQHRRNKDTPVMMVLQEFLDALPVHVFQMTKDGWREQLIDVVEGPEEGEEPSGDKPIPRLRQVLAPDVTPAVDVLLSSSQAYSGTSFPLDTVVEICPEAILLVQDMAKVMEESQGVALIFDYGEDGTSDTLRAFSKHKQVPLTSLPGQVDVTADVDFFALRKSLETFSDNSQHSQSIHAFGPVTQGEFLMRMGAGDMVIHAIEQDETTEEHAQKLYDALQFLVMPEHMGKRYKVLSLGRKRDGIFAPPGMET